MISDNEEYSSSSSNSIPSTIVLMMAGGIVERKSKHVSFANDDTNKIITIDPLVGADDIDSSELFYAEQEQIEIEFDFETKIEEQRRKSIERRKQLRAERQIKRAASQKN